MERGCEARVLRRLHRHRRALTESAVEQQTLVGRFRKLVQRAAFADVFLQSRVGDMQRTGYRAVTFAFRTLAQIDQRDVRLADQRKRLRCGDRPAAKGNFLLGEPDLHIGRYRDVHHLRIGKLQIVHEVDIFLDRFHLQARIEGLLLADRRDSVALVVMCRVNERCLGKLEQAVEYRLILLARVAVLEISAAGAPDQQRVTGKDTIRQDEAVRIIGVSRRIDSVERQPLDRQPVAIRKTHRDDIGLGLLAHHRDAMRMVTKRTEPGDMVSVQMRVDGFYELEIEFVNEMQIPVDLLQDRIDDQRLSARTAREQIGIGAGRLIGTRTENDYKSWTG